MRMDLVRRYVEAMQVRTGRRSVTWGDQSMWQRACLAALLLRLWSSG